MYVLYLSSHSSIPKVYKSKDILRQNYAMFFYPDIMVKYKVKHSVHLVPVVRLVLNYLNDVALSVRPVEIK